MSALRLAAAVLAKELVDGLRDRRTILMALFFPLLGPVLLVVSLTLSSREAREVEEFGVSVPVVGPERAPNLVAFLEAGGVAVAPAPADPERAVRAGDADVVLVVPEAFGERLREGRPAPLRLVVDASRRHATPAAERVRTLLEAWAHRTAVQRLVVRGVHPSVADPLAIETVDVSTPESRSALVFSVMPYFLVLAIFMGGMSVAIDTTAGERERHSLEPLLANPVPRGALVAGKVGGSSFFSVLALAETCLGFALLPVLLPVERLGFAIRIGPGVVLRIFALFVPLLLAANALMVLVAARARSFRAAQTTLSFVAMLPALPGLFLAVSSARVPAAVRMIPGIAEQRLVARLVRGEPVPAGDVARAMLASLFLAAVLVRLAARLFERGRLLEGS